MLNEEQFASIQYMAGREQFEMDEFSLGFAFAKSIALNKADSEDEFFKGYADAYNARIAPLLQNV